MALRTSIAIACVLGIAVIGCTDERRYVGAGGVYQVALTANTQPAYTAGEDSIYIVEQRVELPIVAPTQTQLDDLQKGAAHYGKLPFPRLPWINRGDLAIEVDFTLSNLDGKAEHQATVIVNGIDEFYEYVPGVKIIDKNPVPDYAQWERAYTVKANERLTRTIREEEMDEVAVDLATVVNGAPNSNEVVFFENKSYSDPRSKPYVPKVVPGLAGFRFGLRATDPGRWLLEVSVRVRDHTGLLADEGAKHTYQIMPKPFMPVAEQAM
jgi:hypothetical protein